MNKNLSGLYRYGQSIWLDSLSRPLIQTGQLKRLIEDDGLTGVTSNPAIFEKAIDGSAAYEDDIRQLQSQGKATEAIYRALVVKDIQDAADLLRPVYERTGGTDGYVSLEVSPLRAHDTQGTVREAHTLAQAVSRPNVMIKIPATEEGIPAIAQCIADGLNINITLLFGLPRYRQVAEAYMSGIEQRLARGGDLKTIRSVASFFLSRIDVLVDQKTRELPLELRGKAAIASAKLAYQMYKEIFGSARFRRLEQHGARKQWLLWASTGTKNKEDSDIKYVESLIGPETINTLPMETIEAYKDHGTPAARLEEDLDEARRVIPGLASLGIDIDNVTQQLEDEGVDKFVKPYEKLMSRLAGQPATMRAS